MIPIIRQMAGRMADKWRRFVHRCTIHWEGVETLAAPITASYWQGYIRSNHKLCRRWTNGSRSKNQSLASSFSYSVLTLFRLAPPPQISLDWVVLETRVPILFRNNLRRSDLPYSKGFMKFGCPEPSKNVWLLKLLFVKEPFDPIRKCPPLWNFGISDEPFFFFSETI